MKAALQASAFFCANAGEGPTTAELTSNAKATTIEIRDLKITPHERITLHSSIADSVPL
jgi:hypothetical protein